MSREMPRILVAHLDPDDVRPVIEARFPNAPVHYVDDPGQVESALAKHDPQVAFTVKQDGFNGPEHRAVLHHPGLQWFHVGGSGYEHIQPYEGSGVQVTNCAGVLAAYLAETVMAGMLSLNGHFPAYLHRQQQREWKQTSFRPLSDQTLLVVGLGHIGSIVAERARHFGMRVLATRRSDTPHPAVDELHPQEALPELLPRADFVSLHVRLNEDTRHLMDARTLSLMPRGSYLINTSRGPVVEEEALVETLRSGHLGGAYLDVFETEPLRRDSDLWSIPNLIMTPHTADNIVGWPGKFAELFVANLELWLAGSAMRNTVQL